MSERVRGEYEVAPRGPVGPRPQLRQRRRPSMSFGLALGLTVIGTLLPGTGLMAANRRRLGSLVFFLFLLLLAGTGYLAVTQRRAILHWAVQPDALNVIKVVLPALGLAWVLVIVGTYRSLRPDRATVSQRLAGSGMIVALAMVILLPLAVGGRYADVQKGVVEHVFASEDSKSATRPKNVTHKDPWGGQDRVNVLLLGGDGGKGRVGIRPDSLQVASIDTETGDTVLFSLPRNLEKVPFPSDSVLADAYPNGTYDGSGDRLEWMLNSIYENVPQQHPGLLDSDNPGADATKLAVGEALGLRLDYFVLINLVGFKELIDALGGITVNINQRVAIGGSSDEGVEPRDWLEPGPNQHLDGHNALWFARGRYGADDYQRMERQRCTMKAIIDQAEPGKVLTRYEAIARSSKDIVLTDIPGSLLPAFVDLSMKVQRGASVKSIAFTNEIIDPWDPDFDVIKSMVTKAVRTSGTEQVSNGSGPDSDPVASPEPTDEPSPTPTDDSDDASPEPSTSASPAPDADSLDDACAYREAVD